MIMKSFTAYLTESHKTYDFRLRIAGELPDDLQAKIKSVLEAYQVDKISTVKRLPIQETPEFPNMGPVEINMFDVSLHYPCNDEQVRTLVAERAGINQACIKVTPANSPYEAVRAGLEQSNRGKEGQSVLEQPTMETETPEKTLVGDARIPELIKELEETRKYQYSNAAGGETPAAKTTNEIPPGQSSPIGTTRNKVINPRKS